MTNQAKSLLALLLWCALGMSQVLSPIWAGLRSNSAAPVERVVIRPGDGDETTLQDTTINSWAPDTVYGGDPQVKIRPGDNTEIIHAPLRWNLDIIPAGSSVQSAYPEMYCTQGIESQIEMSIFEVLRPWQEASATWKKAYTGACWDTPGCQTPDMDRAVLPAARGTVQGLVYEDRDENGEFSQGEAGLGGVLVILQDSDGHQVGFQTTGADSDFTFAALVPATYRIQQYDLPGMYSATPNVIDTPLAAGDLLWVSFGDRYGATLTPTTVVTENLSFDYLPVWPRNLAFPLPTVTPTATPSFVPFAQAVNCGSSAGYQASDDAWYAPDQPYAPGSWGWEGPFAQA